MPAGPPTRRPSTRRGLLGALALLAPLVACHPYIQGDGVFHEESREVGAFTGVSVTDGVVAAVTLGQAQSVRVSGDENLVPEVVTEVRTDPERQIPVLDVSFAAAGYRPVHPLRVEVVLPALRLIRVGPATQLTASSVASDALAVVASDGALVTVSGGGGASLEVSLSGGQGGARLDASGYPSASAAVTLTGGSLAQVDASGTVTGTAAPGCRVANVGAGACQVTDGAGHPVACTP